MRRKSAHRRLGFNSGGGEPTDVPVQIHGMDADPIFVGDIYAARAIVESTADAGLFLSTGDRHHFPDSGPASHDPAATAR